MFLIVGLKSFSFNEKSILGGRWCYICVCVHMYISGQNLLPWSFYSFFKKPPLWNHEDKFFQTFYCVKSSLFQIKRRSIWPILPIYFYSTLHTPLVIPFIIPQCNIYVSVFLPEIINSLRERAIYHFYSTLYPLHLAQRLAYSSPPF